MSDRTGTRWWRQRCWGVMFRGALPTDAPMLLGQAWYAVERKYLGEPSRALLFQTRAQARQWCAVHQATYRRRQDTCMTWRFSVVRVRETVEREMQG